jgi:hypothetical protein
MILSLILDFASLIMGAWSNNSISSYECQSCPDGYFCYEDKKYCYKFKNPKHIPVSVEQFLEFIPPNSVMVFHGDSIIRGIFLQALEFFGHSKWYSDLFEKLKHLGQSHSIDHTYLCPSSFIDSKNITLAFLWNPSISSSGFYTRRPWNAGCIQRCNFGKYNISQCDGRCARVYTIQCKIIILMKFVVIGLL